MKYIIYILLFVLVFSCKNETPNKLEVADTDYEVVEESKVVEISEIDNYERLSIEKLTEYFDLIKLREQHPDFSEDIEKQLKNYASENLINFELKDDFSIENIHQIGEMLKISDTLNKVQLEFNAVSNFIQIEDSVFAYITSKIIVVDGKELKSNKVSFAKK